MTTETKCPCLETCPINMVLKLIGGKWKLQILCALYNEHNNYTLSVEHCQVKEQKLS